MMKLFLFSYAVGWFLAGYAVAQKCSRRRAEERIDYWRNLARYWEGQHEIAKAEQAGSEAEVEAEIEELERMYGKASEETE